MIEFIYITVCIVDFIFNEVLCNIIISFLSRRKKCSTKMPKPLAEPSISCFGHLVVKLLGIEVNAGSPCLNLSSTHPSPHVTVNLCCQVVVLFISTCASRVAVDNCKAMLDSTSEGGFLCPWHYMLTICREKDICGFKLCI